MSVFYTDLIDVVRTSYDENGVRSQTTNQNIPCRIEDAVLVVRNNKGEEITSKFKIVLDYSTMLDYNDSIKIKKIAGNEWTEPDKEWPVLKLENARMMTSHHMEVLV